MKFEKLAIELDRKDKCSRLGLGGFFYRNVRMYDFRGCNLCNKEGICEYTNYCPDCLLYVWKVKNNWFSKKLFKLRYTFLAIGKEFKELISDILESIKDDPFPVAFVCVMFFMLIFTLIAVLI
jgi:hypothetical protein